VELDKGLGGCELRCPEAAAIAADAMQFHDGTRLRCGDFVVMPNHIHWLLRPLGEEELETLLKSVKEFSSRHIHQLLGRSGTFWQKESYDHIVRDPAELTRIRRYIFNNPAKARLRTGEYLYYQGDSLET
jgi:REP element-mobilizing transposase RayT